tara:strand:+ start:335 stop:1384 length:1050 start_codon:yes stop_codon:yes gene_type:complete
MSQAANYFPSQNVSVWLEKETKVGRSQDDTVDNAGLKKLQVTSFTIPEASVPLEFSSARSGQFVTTATQGHHSQGTKLWTFDTVLRGTHDSVNLATDAVFEGGADPSEAVLNNDYVFPTASYKHDSTSSPATFNLRFIDAGADATKHNVVLRGCVGTGFTLTEDIGSEGGELVCTISWATAYMPDNVSAQADDDIGSAAYDTGTPKNIRSLASGSTGINGGALEELVVQSWELSVQRTIERIHYADTTNGSYEPFGYAMTGGFDVTGSMTVIRNDDVHDLIDGGEFHNSTAVDINIAESSGFAIAMDKCLLGEATIDNGGAVLTNTIPFTVVADDDISSTTKMLGVSIA